MKKLYFFAIVLPEPLLSEIQEIKHALSKKYKTYAALKSPAHITLIAPFFYNEENEHLLVKNMRNFVSPVQSFKIELNGFDCFKPRVIFINPLPSQDLVLLNRSFNDYMKDFLPKLKKTSPAFHPHITVANRDWSVFDFEKAWEDYKNLTFSGKFSVDQIALLKLEGKIWELIYAHPLKPKLNL